MHYNTAVQIHWPVTEPQKKGDRIDPSVKETWTALEKLVDEVMPLTHEHAERLHDSHDLHAHRRLCLSSWCQDMYGPLSFVLSLPRNS